MAHNCPAWQWQGEGVQQERAGPSSQGHVSAGPENFLPIAAVT